MDRLLTGQELRPGDEIVSGKGWFAFTMSADGNLDIYRRLTLKYTWSSGSGQHDGAHAVMQADGNLVAYLPDGTAYWSTGTVNHPGASALIQDNGELSVLDAAGQVLWSSGSAVNLDTPTVEYQESGLTFDETSEKWKEFCSAFPCFIQLQWPGYATTIVEDVIDGQDVVIQLWTGLCPQGFKVPGFATPGGIGSEVGIYRRIPGRVRLPLPTSLPFGISLPAVPTFLTQVANALATYADNELWWPFPELGATLEFALINPVTGEEMFHAGPQQGYWLTKWMELDSYNAYAAAHPTPARFEDYILEFRVNGRRYRWWPADPRDPLNAQPAISLLLT
jgi:hypothetical protein